MIDILTNEYRQPAFPDGFSAVELDLGCGKGKFTLELAERYPERLVVGLDVMLGRLAKIDSKMTRRKLKNVMLLRAESSQAVAFQLPVASIDRIHLLCPDPWPKEKRKGRRLVCMAFLATLPRIMKQGAILHMATDYRPYFDDWQRMLDNIPWLQDAPNASDDIKDIKTDFELQWEAEGKSVWHLNRKLKRK